MAQVIKMHRMGTDQDFLALMHRRPRVALRRVTDPRMRCAVKSFILNWRHPAARAKALEAVEQILR